MFSGLGTPCMTVWVSLLLPPKPDWTEVLDVDDGHEVLARGVRSCSGCVLVKYLGGSLNGLVIFCSVETSDGPLDVSPRNQFFISSLNVFCRFYQRDIYEARLQSVPVSSVVDVLPSLSSPEVLF